MERTYIEDVCNRHAIGVGDRIVVAYVAEMLETFVGTARITALEAIPFAVPYRREPKFASGTVTSADNVLVRVHSDAGLVGQAEAQPRPYTYGETQASIVHTVRATLEDLLVGLNPLDTEVVN